MATKNLFKKAKEVAAPKTAKDKDKKVRIPVEDATFFNKIKKLSELNETMKTAKATADMISDEVRDLGKSLWSELFNKTGRNPGSVMLEAQNAKGDTAQVMFLPADRYINITEDRAEALREEFGDEIVEEKTTFAFDNDMVDKYGEVISELIESSDDISEADKAKIIKAVTSFSIKKGTIDKMNDFGDVAEIFEAIKPVVSLKGAEIVNG